MTSPNTNHHRNLSWNQIKNMDSIFSTPKESYEDEPKKQKGFLDLPAEIRNMVRHSNLRRCLSNKSTRYTSSSSLQQHRECVFSPLSKASTPLPFCTPVIKYTAKPVCLPTLYPTPSQTAGIGKTLTKCHNSTTRYRPCSRHL